jgi:3-hydroxyacyl-CoA dehydrogenase/enoyl-CoA hydratase/3-hydroxybutyryl-CoA epimerase
VAVQRDARILSEGEQGEPSVALEIGEGGIAWLSLPRTAGIARLPDGMVAALGLRLQEIEAAAREGSVQAVVLRSAPRTAFAANDELESLLAFEDARDAAADALSGQRVLRRLELLSIPSVAAMEGSWFGATLEVALACSYRVASAAPTTRFAFPQLRLGLSPGLGGTVRLPRLIGVEAALRLLVGTPVIDAAAADELGLVDRTLPPPEMEAGVAAFALERVEHGRIRTGARRRLRRRLLEDTAPGRRILLSRAARLAPETPAASAAVHGLLKSVGDGLSLPLERAFEQETEIHGQLVVSEAARSLIHAALLDADATHRHPATGRPIERVAVLGADEEGTELAWLLARARLAVRLKDRERSAVATSVHILRERLSAVAGAAGASAEDARRQGERVEGTVGFGGFGTLDLVVAAVGSSPEAARAALVESEEHVSDQCVLAIGSPLVSMAAVAAALRDPSRAVGLVATRPAELFPVLEIVSDASTAPETLATACRLARQLGCTPIHVADRPGLVVHRLLAVFLAEATRLVEEGARVEAVDGAAEEFGFSMGPLRRIDAIGIQRTRRLLESLGSPLGERARAAPVLKWLAERPGRFYRYRRGRPLAPNPELPARAAGTAVAGEILDRLLLLLVNEAARVLEERGVESPADLDLGAIFGLGYPRRRGGLLYQADRTGLSAVEAKLQALAAERGEIYRPAAHLSRLAAAGSGFYPARHAGAGHAAGEMLT